MSTSKIIGCYWLQHKPDDYSQEQLEFENRKHKTNGYLIHIPLGLRKRNFYFRTVYMYTSVHVYVLYCTYVITYMYLTNCTELDYIENLSLNDTPRSEVHNMFDTILHVITILLGLDTTIMMIRLITSYYRLCIINPSVFNIINLILKIYLSNCE